jgi:hypothetical protein
MALTILVGRGHRCGRQPRPLRIEPPPQANVGSNLTATNNGRKFNINFWLLQLILVFTTAKLILIFDA